MTFRHERRHVRFESGHSYLALVIQSDSGKGEPHRGRKGTGHKMPRELNGPLIVYDVSFVMHLNEI